MNTHAKYMALTVSEVVPVEELVPAEELAGVAVEAVCKGMHGGQ